jgi:hypothetical protein
MYNKTNSHRDRLKNLKFRPPSINSMAVLFSGDKLCQRKFAGFIV